MAFGTGIAVVYAQDTYANMMQLKEPSKVADVLNNTFSRSAWGFALAWLIFACFHGYGGTCIVRTNS